MLFLYGHFPPLIVILFIHRCALSMWSWLECLAFDALLNRVHPIKDALQSQSFLLY